MKKIISLILVVVLVAALAFSLCSCEKAECDFCGEEKTVRSMKKSELFGQTIYTCKDCQKEIDEAKDAVNDLFN